MQYDLRFPYLVHIYNLFGNWVQLQTLIEKEIGRNGK